MLEVHVLIPTHHNNGAKFTASHHQAFEQCLVELIGGFSRLPNEAHGGWVKEGVYYPDKTRVYTVSIKSLTHGDKIGTVVALAKQHYEQEAIYIRYLNGVSEIL
jgi:hypothetical protein